MPWGINRKIILWIGGAVWCAFCAGAVSAAGTSAAGAAGRDVLVYKDGDRVQGHLLSHEGDLIVFKSDRFGELRVPAADAVVVPAEQSAEPPAVAATTPAPTGAPAETKAAAEHAAQERLSLWEKFSPWALTARVRNFFGPWHGKFAFSTEAVTDTTERQSVAVEAHLTRKWKADEVQLNGRLDNGETNHVTTNDVVKGDGLWRHDFKGRVFALYRPTLEWNRAYVRDGVPADYVLLQEEIGAGLTLLNTRTNQLRAGFSENIFDTWVIPASTHSQQAVESGFFEIESKLPWRITVSERGVRYYSLSTGRQGWENKFEIDKKLTETLSVGVRQEQRHNNPDVRAADYHLVRFFLGFDF